MKRAVLYARVSSDLQKKEGTIQSQVIELKNQIAVAGHLLVKEYIDDGYSGAILDRPALNQLRTDLKSKLFDAVYFLNTDRIARDVTCQNIIIGELLKHEKQIIINGQDYIHNPENKFTLTVLGAVAELERAKITERLARGKLHRLRQGYMLANGSHVYGYDYVPRTNDAPSALVINEREAVVVRHIFETYARGDIGIARLTRHLEETGTPTKQRTALWTPWRIKYILKNETYAGTKHFNAWKYVQNEITGKSKKIQRDRSEWIAVKVPAIISRELFDKVQARLAFNANAYRNPKRPQLLSQLIVCGECESRCYSYQRHYKKTLLDGSKRVHHKVAYRCNRRELQNYHSKRLYKRCHNPEISAAIIEPFVFALMRDVMLDPARLRLYMDVVAEKAHASQLRIQRQVRDVQRRSEEIEREKRRIVDIYASGDLGRDAYLAKNRAYNHEAHALRAKRAGLAGRITLLRTPEIIDASIAQFCGLAGVRFEQSLDFDSKRQFLLQHIEKIVYRDGVVSLHGAVPVTVNAAPDRLQSPAPTKLEFRIERAIDRSELRRRIRREAAGPLLNTLTRTKPAQPMNAASRAVQVHPTAGVRHAA